MEGSLQAVVDRIALDLGLNFQIPIIFNQKSGVHRKRLAAGPHLVKRDALSAPSAFTINLTRAITPWSTNFRLDSSRSLLLFVGPDCHEVDSPYGSDENRDHCYTDFFQCE